MKHKKKGKNYDNLPGDYQIDAEIRDAEAKRIHKEPIDELDFACMEEVQTGHADEFLKPTIEDLTR
ncbi:MAG: hypothetical protein GXY32_11460 [Ruminococcaceae bacterium]|mgnify:CR=1 FL=1|nr:hypothetical protein [Oscillospiraceae bacterium]